MNSSVHHGPIMDHLQQLQQLRRSASEAYHRSVEKGRHPRSFPHHCGVFAYVEQSEKRLKEVRSGKMLSTLVGLMPVEDTVSFSDNSLSNLKWKGLLDLEEEAPSEEQQSVDVAVGSPGIDCISMAHDYIREYRPGNIRRQMQSKRLSCYRNRLFDSSPGSKLLHRPSSLAPSMLGSMQKLSRMSQRNLRSAIGFDCSASRNRKSVLDVQTSVYKLNDSQEQKVLYGSKVALGICEQFFFTVLEESGEMEIREQALKRPPTNVKNQPTTFVVSENEIAVFTVFKLDDVESTAPIQDGDEVWLAVCNGSGQRSWKNGSVIGSKTSVISVMDTLKVNRETPVSSPEDSEDQSNGAIYGSIIGQPEAVCANVPNFDSAEIDKKSSLADLHRELAAAAKLRRRNQRALHTGRWTIRIIDPPAKSIHPSYVLNGDQVYFEQNMGFLSCTSVPERNKDPGEANIRYTLPADPSAVIRALSTEAGVVPVDKRGIWTLHLIEDSRTKQEHKSTNQENTLNEATRQLNQSERTRNGATSYAENLHSGEDFPKQIRSVRKELEVQHEDHALRSLERLQPRIGQYFASKFVQLAPIESKSSMKTRLSRAKTLTSQHLKSFLYDSFDEREKPPSSQLHDNCAPSSNGKEDKPVKDWMSILSTLQQEDMKLQQQIRSNQTEVALEQNTAKNKRYLPALRSQDLRLCSYIKHGSTEQSPTKSQAMP